MLFLDHMLEIFWSEKCAVLLNWLLKIEKKHENTKHQNQTKTEHSLEKYQIDMFISAGKWPVF